MAKVLVVAEVKGNEIKKNTLELLSYAKSQNLETAAVLIGDGVQNLADTLAAQGAGTVYCADSASLALLQTRPYTKAIVDAVQQSQATQVWFTHSETGRELIPRVAARLDVGALTDITELKVDGDQIIAYRPAMATKVVQECTFTKEGIRVLSIRGGSFDVTPASPASANVVNLDIPAEDAQSKTKEVVKEVSESVDISDASIVVSVGRGVKDPDGVAFVQPLVDALGAGYGASRAVCDAGWMPHSAQVGQTGKVVAPDVYFAVGISGAIQHLAGMSGSKLIVAINKDPDAPIFKVADYGIVGDLFKAVPLLTEAIQQAKQ